MVPGTGFSSTGCFRSRVGLGLGLGPENETNTGSSSAVHSTHLLPLMVPNELYVNCNFLKGPQGTFYLATA